MLIIINQFEFTIENNKSPDNFYQLISNYDINDFIACIYATFIGFTFNMSNFLTNYYFTPTHILIILIFNQSYYYLLINNNFILNILEFFILLLIFFMLLIFIEIIELYIFNLSFNIKKNIEKRALYDSFVVNNEGNEDEDEDVDEDE